MERPYVGIDLHRRRSVIYTMNADGEKLDCVRIANDPLTLLEAVGKAGADAEVERKMLINSNTTRFPFGGNGPTGECVNSRTKIPVIVVWHAT